MTNRLNLKKYFFLASVGFSAILFGCKNSHEGNDQKDTEKPAIEVFSLQEGKINSSMRVPGELVSFRDVDLYAKVSSFCKQLYVDVGTEVREGQLLALMEAPELVSQLASARSRVEALTATYKASKANYERMLETSKTPGTISQNDLDQALGKSNSDYSQLQAAESTQKEISQVQSYLEIRAPFDGIISARNVSLGAYVGPSGKGSEFPMFVLNEQKKLRLVVYVPEAYTSYLHQNDEIHFSVKAYPNDKFVGKVKRLAGALDKRLRAQRIEMDVANENKKLLPGMIAEVEFSLSTNPNTFVVPSSALVNSTERVFVIRITDKKADWVDVKKGMEINGQVEIFGPLNLGDQLVKTASEEIRKGADVNTTTAKKKE
ncbi:MAG TPA: efflux RND transporter periplasmic adaptor subunit [Cyclobacteriaceae bacterium]|jgi:RND family efflux transporter MFP subunit|nr:efflux RND transporter periplasmic adaptor subunit [Cyclobacteriaceae bacterium]